MAKLDDDVYQVLRDGFAIPWVAGFRGDELQYTVDRDPFVPPNTISTVMRQLINDTLLLGAIEKCARSELKALSPTFHINRKSETTGGYRLVASLKKVNTWIQHEPFTMIHLKDIVPHLRAGMHAVTLDISSAYLHVPVAMADRPYLGFCLGRPKF